ncbi:MAG: arylamine N-acetyltransferase [Nannocystaceae bacterium]
MIQDADRLFRSYMQALGWLGDPGLFELVRTHVIKVPVENVSALLSGATTLPSIDAFLTGIRERDLGGDAITNNGYFAELLAYLDYDVELLGGEIDGDPFAHAIIKVLEDGRPHLVDVGLGAPFYEPIAVDTLPFRMECGDWVYSLGAQGDDTYTLTTTHGGAATTCVIRPTPRTLADFAPTIERRLSAGSDWLSRLRITRVFAASRIAAIDNASVAITHHNETVRRPLADLAALSESVVEDLQLHNLPIADAVAALEARGVDVFAD